MNDSTDQLLASASTVIAELTRLWSGNYAVEAVLLFGSYAHGTATVRSDIDFYVVAADAARVNGDGMYYVRGHLIEAFVNTRGFFEDFFDHFHRDNSRIGQTQFATAKLLFDRTGEGAAIQRTARDWLAKPRIRQSVEQAYWPKRVIWSRFERLPQLVLNGHPSAPFAVHSFVYDVYSKYAAYLGEPVVPSDRLDGYLSDPAKRPPLLIKPFADGAFADVLLATVRAETANEMLAGAEQLKSLALIGMGGFEVAERAG